MNEIENDPFTLKIPAYALGALDWEEIPELRAHLKTCQKCRAELEAYQHISQGLMVGLPQRLPPVTVKRKLQARLHDSRKPIRWWEGWIFSFGRVARVAAILLLIGTNILAFVQIHDLRQKQTQLAGQLENNQTILGMLAASTEVHPVASDTFSANLLLDRGKNLAYLLTWNLPALPDHRVYQIWLIDPQGQETSAGIFRPETDRPFTSAALTTSRTFVEFVGIEVTVEPEGGSDLPTGTQVFNVAY